MQNVRRMQSVVFDSCWFTAEKFDIEKLFPSIEQKKKEIYSFMRICNVEIT